MFEVEPFVPVVDPETLVPVLFDEVFPVVLDVLELELPVVIEPLLLFVELPDVVVFDPVLAV